MARYRITKGGEDDFRFPIYALFSSTGLRKLLNSEDYGDTGEPFYYCGNLPDAIKAKQRLNQINKEKINVIKYSEMR